MNTNDKRVALITGVKRGIGFEIARQLASKNITVILGARDETRGVEDRDRLAAWNRDVHFFLQKSDMGFDDQGSFSKKK